MSNPTAPATHQTPDLSLFRRGRRVGQLALAAHRRGAIARATLLMHLRSAYFCRWHAQVLAAANCNHLATRRTRAAQQHIDAARALAASPVTQ
jgi:hypothetical protein